MTLHRLLCTSIACCAIACGVSAQNSKAPVVSAQTPFGARAILAMHQTGVAFFQDQFGVTVPNGFVLIAARRYSGLQTQFDLAGVLSGGLGEARACPDRRVGGMANRMMVALCWSDVPGVTPEASAVMVHELMHQVQFSLANDRPARRAGNDWLLGPAWLVEGSAEWVEEIFRNGRESSGTRLFKLQEPARRNSTKLQDIGTTGSLGTGRAYGVARFAAYLLAERYGDQALFDYFTALGRTQDRDAAFQDVFDMSLDEFMTTFEDIRSKYGDARRWAGVDG